MKKTWLVLVAAFSLTLSNVASASLLLEPYVGYSSLTAKTGTQESKITGAGYGARVGWGMLGFGIGVDYMASAMKDDETISSTFEGSDLGVFVSYSFPVLVRGYLTYVPTTKSKVKNIGGSADYEGSGGMKVGLGFSFFPMVSLNLEYNTNMFNKANGTSYSPETKVSGFSLGLSLPLSL